MSPSLSSITRSPHSEVPRLPSRRPLHRYSPVALPSNPRRTRTHTARIPRPSPRLDCCDLHPDDPLGNAVSSTTRSVYLIFTFSIPSKTPPLKDTCIRRHM
ncbi:hypothetical protein HN51_053006 [Arachis hypogaea]